MDNNADLESLLCSPPLTNDGQLHFVSDGAPLGLFVWYYDCSKYFAPPLCATDYHAVLGGHYSHFALPGETTYSEGGHGLSYDCRGPISSKSEMICTSNLIPTLTSTSDFERTYECRIELGAPYCHFDFRDQSPAYSGSQYTWEGGWGDGFLKYMCSYWRDQYDPPNWPVQ